MNGVALAVFLLAIYLPHTFFRAIAERYVDLGRRRDVSQFDEIVAPIIPSALFHLQTWIVVHGLCFVRNRIPLGAPWQFPTVDWRLVLTLGSDTSLDPLIAVLDDRYRLMWPLAYVIALTFVTFINAISLGRGALLGLYTTADPDIYPAAQAQVDRRGFWNPIKIYVAGTAFWAWKLFYWESFVPMFSWAVLKPFVFVKTKEGTLFHGRFERYGKSKDGEIDTIAILQASRFTRRPIREALRAGEHPLRGLKGMLILKWSEVADINTTVPNEIRDLWKRWDRLRAKDQAPAV
ncbi:MAG: hypothetical protein JOZ54_09370 [Acidobacteria bacterium]|nr:hypothetical protein [Acidobacteriota bacterium]